VGWVLLLLLLVLPAAGPATACLVHIVSMRSSKYEFLFMRFLWMLAVKQEVLDVELRFNIPAGTLFTRLFLLLVIFIVPCFLQDLLLLLPTN
jgi:hypothetical protein